MIDHISLITGNEGKAREYATLLGIDVSVVKEDLIEIQSLDVSTRTTSLVKFQQKVREADVHGVGMN